MNYPLQVGSLVVATVTTAICNRGERGVCYEQYTIGKRPGWSFIFERGGYDGFSANEAELMLEVTGEVCDAVADYEFVDVTRLIQDYQQGRFTAAFD